MTAPHPLTIAAARHDAPPVSVQARLIAAALEEVSRPSPTIAKMQNERKGKKP